MQMKHYALVAAALGALAMQINGLHDWHSALTPAFVSGAIIALSSTFTAIATQPPSSDPK